MRTLAMADADAQKIINKWTTVAVPTGMIPGSPLLLPGLDVALIADIANCYEVKNYAADAVLATIGASIAGRTAASVALTFIPVAGWIINGAIAGGTTRIAGKIMMDYFRERSQLPRH